MNFLNKIDRTLKENYSQIFLVALFLLSFVFLNVLLSSILFIFKISINVVVPIISVILTILRYCILYGKKANAK